MGSVDTPINPVLFALGAKATFIARTPDNNPKHMVETFKAAHAHQGVSFVEILQNCVIFNDKTWDSVYSKENRSDNLIFLEKDKPLLFGKDKTKGVIMHGVHPRAVEVGENDFPLEDVLIHHPDHESPLFVRMLALMGPPHLPTPVGILRERSAPTYEEQVLSQTSTARAAMGEGTWDELLKGSSSWEVE